jgi:hypothetical protein
MLLLRVMAALAAVGSVAASTTVTQQKEHPWVGNLSQLGRSARAEGRSDVTRANPGGSHVRNPSRRWAASTFLHRSSS